MPNGAYGFWSRIWSHVHLTWSSMVTVGVAFILAATVVILRSPDKLETITMRRIPYLVAESHHLISNRLTNRFTNEYQAQ
jgi:hypothetical protein